MSDSEPEYDITSGLLGASSSRKGKARAAEPEQDEDDETLFIQETLNKRLLKDGAEAMKASNKGKKAKTGATGGGSFQSLGLSPVLLRSLLLRGFTVPTPIQRASLPSILASPPRDVVGMARTGSGKTLAYMIPLIQRLGGAHSPTFGCRALVLVPTRELALQVLRVGKDLARGAREAGVKEGLRWSLIVGGEGIEEQFDALADNPDVIIATPGRLLHLTIEMNMDFKAVQLVIFDEADRLFELGFATQLHEILDKLPPTRQSLLFSATLPKSLVEFAKAGLQNPKLVRLDADSKISPDLQMAFLNVKPTDKEAALLVLLRDIIRIPTSDSAQINRRPTDRDYKQLKDQGMKRKRPDKKGKAPETLPWQTLIFAATKHQVEFLTVLLMSAGYTVSQIYGTLDQTNRSMQLADFKEGRTNILCVTDLAARGIDIPLLENVVNYDFPVGSRSFVHRVGRTARAGRRGWAYSLLTNHELPHLLDLELFLSRPLLTAPVSGVPNYATNLVIGTFPRTAIDSELEHLQTVLIDPNPTLIALQGTAQRGQKMYERSSAKASPESYRRAKTLIKAGKGLAGSTAEEPSVHPIFEAVSEKGDSNAARTDLLATINSFKPNETVFEIGSRGNKGKNQASMVMQARRKALDGKIEKRRQLAAAEAEEQDENIPNEPETGFMDDEVEVAEGLSEADEDDLEQTFGVTKKAKKQKQSGFRDESVYMNYVQEGAATEKGYSLDDGASFAAQAAKAAFSLDGVKDELNGPAPQRASMLRWDRKTKRIVQGDGVGADNKKIIRTESGARLPASFRSGKYEEWQAKKRVRMPRVGDAELPGRQGGPGGAAGGKRWTHKGGRPGGDDEPSEKKAGFSRGKVPGVKTKMRNSAVKSGRPGAAKGGLRNVDQITKERKMKDSRKRRSEQPSKKKPTKGGKGKKR